MPPLYLLLWTFHLALSQSSFHILEEHCSLKFANNAHEILVFNANQYQLISTQKQKTAYLICLDNNSVNELTTDSNHVLSELTDCLSLLESKFLQTQVFQYTFVCFFSSNDNAFVHSKRVELLQKACFNLPIRLIFVQQEFPHQMYFENLSSDE